jgi:hypothetical protein
VHFFFGYMMTADMALETKDTLLKQKTNNVVRLVPESMLNGAVVFSFVSKRLHLRSEV